MSIGVALEQLAEELERFGPVAYVLTVGGDGRPHAVAVEVHWEGGRLVAGVGTSTAANVAERAHISLLWPPYEPGGYSLIADGDAEVVDPDAPRIAVDPTRAVLHRPAPSGSERRSDCVPLMASDPTG